MLVKASRAPKSSSESRVPIAGWLAMHWYQKPGIPVTLSLSSASDTTRNNVKGSGMGQWDNFNLLTCQMHIVSLMAPHGRVKHTSLKLYSNIPLTLTHSPLSVPSSSTSTSPDTISLRFSKMGERRRSYFFSRAARSNLYFEFTSSTSFYK